MLPAVLVMPDRDVDNQKPILDYSSPASEQAREEETENQRKRAIETYNESTFGERKPIASLFLRTAVLCLVLVILIFFLPRDIGRPLAWLAAIAFVIWDAQEKWLANAISSKSMAMVVDRKKGRSAVAAMLRRYTTRQL
jgi:hypothetical protein